MQAIRPNVVLMNEAVPLGKKMGPFLHAAGIHGPVRASIMAGIGAKHAITQGVDQAIAPLVTAIRSGSSETFRAAIRDAAAAGVPAATITAAEETFARRQGHRR